MRRPGVGAQEPVEAGLEGVTLPPPAGGEAAGPFVHLQELDLVAASKPVDSGAQAGDPAANDHDLAWTGGHGSAPWREACEAYSEDVTKP
jgi:hypothetical protein